MLPQTFIVLLPMSMISFQSAGQIVMSRFLGYNELSTLALTSNYCDLFMDPAIFTAPVPENSARNQRASSAIALLLGAMMGGALTGDGSIVEALWVAAAVKVAVALAWLAWPSKGSIRLD